MKRDLIILGGVAALGLAGCTTTQVTVAPVGPNPAGVAAGAGNGELEVFSAYSARFEGDDQSWQQHSDYVVYYSSVRRVKHVMNEDGYYSTSPELVALPAGKYVVKARAEDALLVMVPVVIKADEVTEVHLDDQWQPGVSGAEVVMSPEGYPVGWRAGK